MQNVIQLHPMQRGAAAHRDGAHDTGTWEVERDVIRGRAFDRTAKFMPDGLSQVGRLEFLEERERTLLSQIQGRTYANMFRLLERFIGANMFEVSRGELLGDHERLASLVSYTQDEIKHQALFGRIDLMMAGAMPQGYRFQPRANDVAWLVLGRSRWSVLALTCMVELLTQAHYRESIAPDPSLSELYKDVFLFHWRDEERHIAVSEREWRRENEKLTPKERDCAVDEFVEHFRTLNTLLQRQTAEDASYFFRVIKRPLSPLQAARVQTTTLRAYRWQYMLSGVQHERFADVLAELVTEAQGARIAAAIRRFAGPEADALCALATEPA